MKKIGIIGGMSWESTIEYYRIINSEINKRLGGVHSASMFIESYDFQEIEELQHKGGWTKMAEILSQTAVKLEKCGADFLLIATNTMHKVAPHVANSVNIPLLHIADATAEAILKENYSRVALLGTKFTMQKDGFYLEKLADEYNLDVIVPDEASQDEVHRIIFDELCKGLILDESKNKLLEIIDNCRNNGAEAVVLGCTELPNIIKTSSLPIINTTEVHCLAAVEKALAKEIKE